MTENGTYSMAHILKTANASILKVPTPNIAQFMGFQIKKIALKTAQ
jgi:hypothetical protein